MLSLGAQPRRSATTLSAVLPVTIASSRRAQASGRLLILDRPEDVASEKVAERPALTEAQSGMVFA